MYDALPRSSTPTSRYALTPRAPSISSCAWNREPAPLLLLRRSTRSSPVNRIFIPFHGRSRRHASPSRSVSLTVTEVAPSVSYHYAPTFASSAASACASQSAAAAEPPLAQRPPRRLKGYFDGEKERETAWGHDGAPSHCGGSLALLQVRVILAETVARSVHDGRPSPQRAKMHKRISRAYAAARLCSRAPCAQRALHALTQVGTRRWGDEEGWVQPDSQHPLAGCS